MPTAERLHHANPWWTTQGTVSYAQREDLLRNIVDQLEHLKQNLAGVSAHLIALEIFRCSNKSNQEMG